MRYKIMEIIEYNKLVGQFRTRKDEYPINREYQREPSIWTLDDKQYLIDTILKNLDLPKFYFRKLDDKKYEIVDGQQRLETIWKFYEEELWIPGERSGYEKKRVYYSDLSEDDQDIFDSFPLNGRALINFEDKDTRELFSRLQRGKPLNVPEKLNAFPGDIVPLMRDLGAHPFFSKVKFSIKRYKNYHIAAKLLLIEKDGFNETQPNKLFVFFKLNERLSNESKVAKKINCVLNFMDQVFPESKVPEINSEPWFLNIYLLSSRLLENYNIDSKQKNLYYFYIRTWAEVEKARKTSSGETEIQRFVDANTKGTNSKANIDFRFNFLIERFLQLNEDMELLDPNRYFDHYEKTVIYRRDEGICQECGEEVEWDEYDADHIKSHAKGGKTNISNGQVLCYSCNRSLGKK